MTTSRDSESDPTESPPVRGKSWVTISKCIRYRQLTLQAIPIKCWKGRATFRPIAGSSHVTLQTDYPGSSSYDGSSIVLVSAFYSDDLGEKYVNFVREVYLGATWKCLTISDGRMEVLIGDLPGSIL